MTDSVAAGQQDGGGSVQDKNNGPIVHVRADSDSTMQEMFAVVQNPGGSNTPLSIPLRMRNLPPSFFNPPSSRSPVHSREGSAVSNHDGGGSSLQDRFSPGPKSVGSPQPNGQMPPPNHNRSQSAPVELGVNHVQSVQQQHVHLRQPSYDGSNSSSSGLLGPLPPGWEPARTPTGQMYFMNHITKTTQWEDPRQQIQQQMNRERQQSALQRGSPQLQQSIGSNNNNSGALPSDWEQSLTAEGEIYFINHTTKTTSWFDPRLPIHNQTVPIRQQQNQTVNPQQQQLINMQAGQHVGQGMTVAQKRQQDIRLQRLENERRVLQQRQAELKRFMASKQEHLRQQQSQEKMLNTTQEMLMRQNLNDNNVTANNSQGQPPPPPPPPQQVIAGLDPFLSTAQQAAQQGEMHNRQESADSGLGMGSNFNLGSIPEDDLPMDTSDLDTTLTENGNNVPAGTTVLMTNGAAPQPGVVPDEQLISTLPNEIPNLGDENDLMLNDILGSRQGQWI